MPTLRIDDELWRKAPALRRQEWRVLIADLTRDESPWASRKGSVVILGCADGYIRIRLTDNLGQSEALDLAHTEIGAELGEYLTVIERLSEEGLTAARAEALDMAKRVVHDKAARRIGTLLPDLSPNLETRRRFFSLLVAIVTDTTGKATRHPVR